MIIRSYWKGWKIEAQERREFDDDYEYYHNDGMNIDFGDSEKRDILK
jgi:hypothetical protein